MKEITKFNCNWIFLKDVTEAPTSLPTTGEVVNLPHTWNAIDGQDGGCDYWRGTCCYANVLGKYENKRVYIEVLAASSSATICVNGKEVISHDGGYSIFRADITDALTEEENLIAILVDNGSNDRVYPQTADFTFYGGLYRGVNIITVDESHFDLDYYGGKGLTFSAEVEEDAAIITLDAYVTEPTAEQNVEFVIRDAEGKQVASAVCTASAHVNTKLRIEHPHLWQGIEDPYLYEVTAYLTKHNDVLDEVSDDLGIRTFHVDPQKGFFLNGKLTPLRGVSRHQDMFGIGNALTKEEHDLDAELIRELGANTVRLAHYQHSEDFYRACNRLGFIVWAEIPFISVMSMNPEAHENCRSQMKELIIQNYNHPCICFWGISNEITIGGERPGLVDNLKDLNNLVHELDSTRLSTIAQVSTVPMENGMNEITDTVSYNHYFGWYIPGLEKNEAWLDAFHEMHPSIPLGLSEYGAEGIITYHNDEPKVRDYSEEYQAIYHEHMAKIINERPWLWATHVWNMFDFGCDARDEGGVKGRNNKGLMTFDRKIRKDSYFVYKAYWSNEAFVHLCSKRFAERTGETTTVKVYSNQPNVTLHVNGEVFAELSGDKVFVFENVPLTDLTMIVATAGECIDSMTIKKVAEPNPAYILIDEEEDGEGVANWFNPEDYQDVSVLEVKEGFFSIKDTIEDIIANDDAANVLVSAINKLTGMKIKKTMLNMVKDMPVEKMIGMTGNITDAMLIALNEALKTVSKE